eukprot:scaffold35136_cov22-Tisochrysis_lutea.AAC.1
MAGAMNGILNELSSGQICRCAGASASGGLSMPCGPEIGETVITCDLTALGSRGATADRPPST